MGIIQWKGIIHETFFVLILLCCCLSCNSEKDKSPAPATPVNETEIAFDKVKWKAKKGLNYLFREQMLNGILYSDDFRKLKEGEVLEQLGEPDRINENFLYYEISRNRLGLWTLNTRTMVVKFADDKTIEWIKLSE